MSPQGPEKIESHARKWRARRIRRSASPPPAVSCESAGKLEKSSQRTEKIESADGNGAAAPHDQRRPSAGKRPLIGASSTRRAPTEAPQSASLESPHIKRYARLIRHAALIPWRIEHHIHFHARHAWHHADSVFNPRRHFPCNRASWRRQRHFDRDKPAVVDIHVVNEAEFVNVRRDFRVVNRLQRSDDRIRSARAALQASSPRAASARSAVLKRRRCAHRSCGDLPR